MSATDPFNTRNPAAGVWLNNLLEGLSFNTLFNAAADAMLLVDNTGHVMQANPATLQLLGYTEDKITGLAVEALMPARYRAQHGRYRDQFSSQPQKRPMGSGQALVALSCDGRELPVDISLSPLQVRGQSCVLVTLYTASQRRQAEDALRSSEERLQLAKHVAGFGVFDRDLTQGTLHWDERSRELWGLAPEEAVTYEKFVAGIHPEDSAPRQAAIDQALDPAGDGEYHSEFRVIRRSDGATRWVATTGQVFFESGRAARLVGIMQDVTEHKAVEQKLQEQRAEMESLIRQQVAVHTASAIAHDLNQPLAAISAYAEVALGALNSRSESPERLRRALEGTVEQAHRAGNVLHELLGFLQKGETVPEPINLNAIVKEALAIAKNSGYSGFEPVLILEHDLPPVLANRLHVQKVLVNLLLNSVEAMREASVPAAEITIMVRTMAARNMAHVTLQDRGPGLDAETAQRVFEPFFTTKPKGIGMGLAISRTLIEAHGGQLWLDPEAKPGATFHFTLPFAP